MSFETTDAEKIRAAVAAGVSKIVPRYTPRRDERWTYLEDQEISGTLRNFDVILEAEVESTDSDAWYSGGISMNSATEIRVSYPLSEVDARRFAGADGQDLAGMLVRLNPSVPGMFGMSVNEGSPIFQDLVFNGEPGAYVVSFFCTLHFFVSDQVDLTG